MLLTLQFKLFFSQTSSTFFFFRNKIPSTLYMEMCQFKLKYCKYYIRSKCTRLVTNGKNISQYNTISTSLMLTLLNHNKRHPIFFWLNCTIKRSFILPLKQRVFFFFNIRPRYQPLSFHNSIKIIFIRSSLFFILSLQQLNQGKLILPNTPSQNLKK